MTRTKDQFKLNDILFTVLVNLIYNTLHGVDEETPPDLGIPSDIFTEYLRLLKIWNKINDITKNKSSATSTNRVARNEARKELENFVRNFVKKWLYNNMPPCTPEIITSCGMKPHSKKRLNHQERPKDTPSFYAKPSDNHGFICGIKNTSGGSAKPDGVDIMRIRYFEGENPPDDPAKFEHFQDFSRTPIVLDLAAENAGMSIAMASCHVNTSGEEGPYSTVIYTKIP